MRIEPGYVEIVSAVLRDLGHDPLLFPLPRTGVVSEGDFRTMSENLVAVTQDPSIALRLGSHMHLGTHGLLGHAILSSRSLRQAAGLLIQYSPLQGTHGNVQLSFNGENAVLTFESPFEVEGAPNFMVELFFAGLLTALRQLIGPLPEACRIELAYEPQMSEAVYRRYFGVHVSFNHRKNRFIGPNERIDQPLSAAEIPVADMYRRQCERLLRDMNAANGFGGEVRRMILAARGRFPGMEEAARRLNMSERTLRRRLAAEHSSYRAIVDDVRSYLAREYLRETPLTVTDVASLLGFDDVANFRRAFRKWNECSPQEFRVFAQAQNGTDHQPADHSGRRQQSATQLHTAPHHKTLV
ncbi:AraC family transcriptional regulator [Parvibaculum sp.]|uniref:AraC family transcriptional regulator n=1 Tax=Parvibaculum sp. TaxID=2024848 RepID=UPI001B06E594|nr:AraC family transcriptional regulator [Parvibaculum sp.]MBO6668210.1 AraC family transcriptional regulator [Parvibaculum sp.]MBO6690954.1 AraC family transcriptional regulator [Parvibaculum sp.]MBO6714672.1 AraC family transcriptional regulator [Parvibaculum sp.]